MTSVAIIDDHAMVRMGLKYLLSFRNDEFAFAGEFSHGEGAAKFAYDIKPDVLLLDIRMPDKDGVAVLEEILLARPDQRVIMLTTSEADEDVYRSIMVGARGYVLKDRDSDDLLAAIRAVMEGRRFFPPAVMEIFRRRQQMEQVTKRELDVLESLAQGLSNDEIGERLGIGRNGVKSHLKNIFAKLNVSDRVSAAREAVRRGFVKSPFA